MFDAGELAKAFDVQLQKLALKNSHITITERLPDGTESSHETSFQELERICDLVKQTVHLSGYGENGSVSIILYAWSDRAVLQLYISASSAQVFTDIRSDLEKGLKLEPQPEPQESDPVALSIDKLVAETMGPVHKRLEALEEKILSASRRLRCFLSYRFNDATELIALRVQQFLTALDVEVLTGASYEPRQVSEKVLSRLREPLDFVVLLITGDGESMWTRDEIGTAIHKGIALVPIVQKGAHLQPGLFADVEYIEFEADHIGDAFLKLLQAVRFVREQKSNTVSSDTQINVEPSA